MMKTIAYVTGTRADYELMRGLLNKISKKYKLNLYTATDLIDKPGKLMSDLIKVFTKNKADLLLIEGDRPEALVTAFAGLLTNTPIAHLSGGDISGHRDNKIRYSITALADYHLPGTTTSAVRLLKQGISPDKIFVTGHLMNTKTVTKKELDKVMGFNVDKDTIIVLQHPVTGQEAQAGEQMSETLKAVLSIEKPTKLLTVIPRVVIIHPNSDPGSEEIIKVIESYNMDNRFEVHKNIPGKMFSTLMKHSGVLIGNSSCGITEAPYWNLPVVNVGNRQEGRERADNIIEAPHNTGKIIDAIRKAKKLRMKYNPYNPRQAETNTMRIIKNILKRR
jgi:GDP/UDP-N,N'-diacetylbacillosamine 2-epimerase (hydrolysing)